MIWVLLQISLAIAHIHLHFERDTQLPLVSLNIIVPDGNSTQEGLTAFVAELLLRGTQTKSRAQLNLALDELGATLTVDPRAEFWVLRGSVLSSQLEPFLELIREILLLPQFDEKEIQKLKKETVSAIDELESHDPLWAMEQHTRFLFQNHPFGLSQLGTPASVKRFSRGDVLKHYSEMLQLPLTLVAFGDAHESVLTTWAKTIKVNPKQLLKELPQTKPRPRKQQWLYKPDLTQSHLLISQLGPTFDHPDLAALFLANTAFGGGGFTSILMNEIRVKRGWTYGARSSFLFGSKPRSWSVSLSTTPQNTKPALDLTLKLIEGLKKNGLTLEQFQSAKKTLVKGAGFTYNTAQKRAENRILEQVFHLKPNFFRNLNEDISKLNYKTTQKAIQNFFKPETLQITILTKK